MIFNFNKPYLVQVGLSSKWFWRVYIRILTAGVAHLTFKGCALFGNRSLLAAVRRKLRVLEDVARTALARNVLSDQVTILAIKPARPRLR